MQGGKQVAIEISRWMYPAFVLSGWLAPLAFIINIILEVLKWL